MAAFSGLQVDHLRVLAGQQVLLDDVAFTHQSGRVLGILGPNGAGKTTLLNSIAALQPASLSVFGQTLWNGYPVQDWSAPERARQIALVQQRQDQVFRLTLAQVVRMGSLPHQTLWCGWRDQSGEACDRALAQTGLGERAQQVFSTLSGGEQQRGLIARALVQQARLLLLDEPVNHLDVYYQHQILGLLRRLAADTGLTVIMTLHDINLAAMYCDDLLVIQQGRGVAHGAVADVLQQSLLESVFGLACRVVHSSHGVRVDFCPGDIGVPL